MRMTAIATVHHGYIRWASLQHQRSFEENCVLDRVECFMKIKKNTYTYFCCVAYVAIQPLTWQVWPLHMRFSSYKRLVQVGYSIFR